MRNETVEYTCDFCGTPMGIEANIEIEKPMSYRHGTAWTSLAIGLHYCSTRCFRDAITNYFSLDT